MAETRTQREARLRREKKAPTATGVSGQAAEASVIVESGIPQGLAAAARKMKAAKEPLPEAPISESELRAIPIAAPRIRGIGGDYLGLFSDPTMLRRGHNTTYKRHKE